MSIKKKYLADAICLVHFWPEDGSIDVISVQEVFCPGCWEKISREESFFPAPDEQCMRVIFDQPPVCDLCGKVIVEPVWEFNL